MSLLLPAPGRRGRSYRSAGSGPRLRLGLYAIPRHSEGSSRHQCRRCCRPGTGRNVIADRAFMKVETRGAINEINAFVYQQALERHQRRRSLMQRRRHRADGRCAEQPNSTTDGWIIRRQAQRQVTELTSVVDRHSERAAGSEDATTSDAGGEIPQRPGLIRHFGTRLKGAEGAVTKKFGSRQVMAVAG